MSTSTSDTTDSSLFLPAKESRLFIVLFDWYCRWLFWRRFDSVTIKNKYHPAGGQKTIYYLNHNSWWDGLIPFMLNQKIFQQNARGMMEDTQLNRFPFFRRMGVFSINLNSARSSMQSLRYAIRSMDRPNASLYIYPQGKIEPFFASQLEFKKGIGWLAKKLPHTDLVPVGIYIHTKESDKPRLVITIGSEVTVCRLKPADEISHTLQDELSYLLQQMVKD